MKLEQFPLRGGAFLTGYIQDTYSDFGAGVARPAVIICPGGGYVELSAREGEPFALACLAAGFQAFVLHYRLLPAQYPEQLWELAEAVSLVRRRAEALKTAPDRIFVMGASAGGHLAAQLGTGWNGPCVRQSGCDAALCRPNGMVLCYPVIDDIAEPFHAAMQQLSGASGWAEAQKALSVLPQVSAAAAPAFIWHTWEDQIVPVSNSLHMAEALAQHQVPFELHIYRSGLHGQALCTAQTQCADLPARPENADWFGRAVRFLNSL